jgi:4-amino-4-deoxychorismate mutase
MLARFREELDSIDQEILRLLSRRLRICLDVAAFKKKSGVPVMQPTRVSEVKSRRAEQGVGYGLDPDFVTRLWTSIIDEACRLEFDYFASEERDTEVDSVAGPTVAESAEDGRAHSGGRG